RFFFFFQAEDGIRDRNVTGVQTCALPICGRRRGRRQERLNAGYPVVGPNNHGFLLVFVYDNIVDNLTMQRKRVAMSAVDGKLPRSEERRVGKEGRSRGWRWEWTNERKTGE